MIDFNDNLKELIMFRIKKTIPDEFLETFVSKFLFIVSLFTTDFEAFCLCLEDLKQLEMNGF